MDPVAALIRHLLFPAWIRKNRSSRLAYLADLERLQFLSADAVRELQLLRFRQVLRHAVDHCPFYRNKLSAAGITAEDIRTHDDICRVPTLSKEEVQESLSEMIADDTAPAALLRDMTGGSTGSPMVFYYSDDRLDSRVAATIRHNRWTGWNIGDKMALLWGAPRDTAAGASMKARLRDWILDRRVILDAATLDERRMRAFCDTLQRHRPKYILAYANTLSLFARFIRDARIEPIRPRAIICSAEVLTTESRALIESTFGCRVFNRYGSREFAVIASECEVHRGLHINAENLLVEVLTDGQGPAGSGEIVITDLRNEAMPLIRYRTRDMGTLIAGRCGCGRGLPLMELSGGRVTDFLTAIGGQQVSGIVLATYGVTEIPGIRQIQFIQERQDRVTARLVRGPAWGEESENRLTTQIRRLLGPSMVIDVQFVDHIPLEASGKYRFSISHLSRG